MAIIAYKFFTNQHVQMEKQHQYLSQSTGLCAHLCNIKLKVAPMFLTGWVFVDIAVLQPLG